MFKPLGNRVLVKPLEEATQTTASGLYITSKRSATRGEVVAAGNGAVTMSGDIIEMEVKEGDTVLYPSDDRHGIEMVFDDVTYILLHETDLFGILP